MPQGGLLASAWNWTLARAALEGGLLVIAVWSLCRLGWRLPAWLRAALWWTACLKLLVAALPIAPLDLALRPSPTTHALAAATRRDGWGETRAASIVARAATPVPAAPQWAWILGALWFAGLLARTGRLLADQVVIRRIARAARPLGDEALARWVQGRRGGAGVMLLVSDAIEVPMVVGLRRPRVLIPATALGRTPETLRLALAHELGHLRHGDLWLGLVPAAAELVFWFHPLAWLAAREYAQAREEACDASAVQCCQVPPGDYAELLLSFGVAHRALALAARCGSTDSHQLRRRLLMLDHLGSWTRLQKAAAFATLGVLAGAALIPLRVVASTSASAIPNTVPPKVSASKKSTTTKSTSTVTTSGNTPVTRTETTTDGSSRYSYSTSDDDVGAERLSYVLADDEDGHSLSGSGDDRDWRAARDVEDRTPRPYLYLRLGTDRYLVTDPAVLRPVREFLAPQRELGRKQGDLGRQQGALGREQGELGRMQGELGAIQAELSGKQALVAARRAQGRLDDADARELDELERQISAQMNEVASRQSRLGERQGELGSRQSELGAMQSKLGEEQQRVSAEVTRRMEALAHDLVRTGKAKPLSD